MRSVGSFDDIQRQVAAIRALRLGFVTNFFPDPVKHGFWIGAGDCFLQRIGNTLFIIKKSPAFWNVFYCAATVDGLAGDLREFQSRHPDVTMMFDLVGREMQCKPLVERFEALGCRVATRLVRMARRTEPAEYVPDAAVRYATGSDLPLISRQLHEYFDERTEQIPYDGELAGYAAQNRILVCEEDGTMAGFLIFELNASTLYLRYWFTHPDYRNRKVGSRLFRRFLEEGKDTRRQLLWVIRTNGNAVRRYRHYGFAEEDMVDFVMQYH